jgi:ligand-binding sensor domain-containing protein
VRFDITGGLSGMLDLAPTVRITSATAGDLFQIGNIAFDRAQNLWVTSFVGLLRFDDPGSQSGDVALTPGAVIEKDGYAKNLYFYSVAFDAGGALWAASGDGLHYLTSVTEFKDPASLLGRSSPAAAATITGDADLLPAGGLAFDGAGNLWMATGESIVMYSGPPELSGIVSPAPAITLKVAGRAAPTTNSHLVFFPPPTGSVARQGPDASAVD